MQTMQVRFPKDLVRKMDKLIKENKYHSRCDVVRDALRRLVYDYERRRNTA
jgi:Arc/MetJ-type ribon-helix-helix transcriptional regulator